MADVPEFLKWKESNQKSNDSSRKGAIDEPIVDLIDQMNALEQYFTTSSCSGRVIVFEQNEATKKKGCKWFLVAHENITFEAVLKSLEDVTKEAVLKFEPFVLHVQCRSLEAARLMHSVSVASGFRNSGITVGKHGKIICAVRSTHSLEVPLSSEGRILVTDEYIQFLVQCANQKMEENFRRIQRFQVNLIEATHKSPAATNPYGALPLPRSQTGRSDWKLVKEDGDGNPDEEFEDFESITCMFDKG